MEETVAIAMAIAMTIAIARTMVIDDRINDDDGDNEDFDAVYESFRIRIWPSHMDSVDELSVGDNNNNSANSATAMA